MSILEIVIDTSKLAVHAVYLFIILILTTLLIISYVSDDEPKVDSMVAGANLAAEPEEREEEPAAPEKIVEEDAGPSCTDGEKNQDETDVDCGGSCPGCRDGKTCSESGDCRSGTCQDDVCITPPTLSGEVTFELEEVNYADGKVNSLDVSVTNEQSETARLILELYLKTYNDIYYLNQYHGDDELVLPYAIIELPLVESGKSLDFELDLIDAYQGGKYLGDTNGKYEKGDDFSVEAVLLDERTGSKITTVKKKVTV